jgi:hypothetical protein
VHEEPFECLVGVGNEVNFTFLTDDSAQVHHSGVGIPANRSGNDIFPESFRSVPLFFLRESTGKSTAGGSSIPEGIFTVSETAQFPLLRRNEKR